MTWTASFCQPRHRHSLWRSWHSCFRRCIMMYQLSRFLRRKSGLSEIYELQRAKLFQMFGWFLLILLHKRQLARAIHPCTTSCGFKICRICRLPDPRRLAAPSWARMDPIQQLSAMRSLGLGWAMDGHGWPWTTAEDSQNGMEQPIMVHNDIMKRDSAWCCTIWPAELIALMKLEMKQAIPHWNGLQPPRPSTASAVGKLAGDATAFRWWGCQDDPILKHLELFPWTKEMSRWTVGPLAICWRLTRRGHQFHHAGSFVKPF